MRLFITGASGFVGHHIAARFRAEGWEVTALARPSSKVLALRELGVAVHVGDLLSGVSYARALEGSDLVVHCAGAIKARNLDEFMNVNARSAGEVTHVAAELGVPRLVLISSIAARGPMLPDKEPFAPVSMYGRSKREGERLVRANAGKMEVTVVRPPPVYGTRDHGMLDVFKFARSRFFPLFGLGEGRTAIVHGRDLAAAVLSLAVCGGKMPPGPFYPEDGSNLSWRDLAVAFEEALSRRIVKMPVPPFLFWAAAGIASAWGRAAGRPVLFSLDKVREMACPSWECSHRPLRHATGWQPKVQLVDGLRETFMWYVKAGWL